MKTAPTETWTNAMPAGLEARFITVVADNEMPPAGAADRMEFASRYNRFQHRHFSSYGRQYAGDDEVLWPILPPIHRDKEVHLTYRLCS